MRPLETEDELSRFRIIALKKDLSRYEDERLTDLDSHQPNQCHLQYIAIIEKAALCLSLCSTKWNATGLYNESIQRSQWPHGRAILSPRR